MGIVIETDLIILLFTISIPYCVTHSILPTYNKDNIIIIVSRSHCDSRENAVLIYHSAEQLIPKLKWKRYIPFSNDYLHILITNFS